MIIDVRTLMSAMAVVQGVNGPDTLNYFTTIKVIAEGTFNGVVYQAVQKYDHNYPFMKPMACIGPKDGDSQDWNCLLPIGDSYGLPFLLSWGANATWPTTCDCLTDVGKRDICDNFDFIAGAIVYDMKKNLTLYSQATAAYPSGFVPFLPFLEVFYVEPVVSGAQANKNVFPAAFAAFQSQSTTGSDPRFKNSNWRKLQYTFSLTNTYGYGSLVVFRTTSTGSKDVTKNYYQLYDGACADSFYSPNFTNFYNNTWGPLNEKYYRCIMWFHDAVFDSIGIATGAAGVSKIASMLYFFI